MTSTVYSLMCWCRNYDVPLMVWVRMAGLKGNPSCSQVSMLLLVSSDPKYNTSPRIVASFFRQRLQLSVHGPSTSWRGLYLTQRGCDPRYGGHHSRSSQSWANRLAKWFVDAISPFTGNTNSHDSYLWDLSTRTRTHGPMCYLLLFPTALWEDPLLSNVFGVWAHAKLSVSPAIFPRALSILVAQAPR